MEVRVKIDEAPEGLRRHDHGGDRALQSREVLGQELSGRGVGGAGEIAVERAVEEEGLAEDLGEGEDQLHIGDLGEDLFDHALGPQGGALFSARGAQPPHLAGMRDQALEAALRATQAKKTEVGISTAAEDLEKLPEPRVERAVIVPEAFVPMDKEVLQVVLDDVLELVSPGAGPVARSRPGTGKGHKEGGR